MAESQDFNAGFSSDFGHPLASTFPNVLRYSEVLTIDYMSIVDWTPVADGVDYDIGIVLRIGRGDILLAYMPNPYDTPTLRDFNDDFDYNDFAVEDDIANVYTSGNIFITTEHQVIWIKAVNPYFPVTASGEIMYNITPDLIVQPFIEPPRLTLG